MIKPVLLCIAISLFIVGCGESRDESLGTKPSPESVKAAQDRKSEVYAIYDRAKGSWDAMTPEDKKRLLELSANDEQRAKQGWDILGKMPR